jgi:hypothetical protein
MASLPDHRGRPVPLSPDRSPISPPPLKRMKRGATFEEKANTDECFGLLLDGTLAVRDNFWDYEDGIVSMLEMIENVHDTDPTKYQALSSFEKVLITMLDTIPAIQKQVSDMRAELYRVVDNYVEVPAAKRSRLG